MHMQQVRIQRGTTAAQPRRPFPGLPAHALPWVSRGRASPSEARRMQSAISPGAGPGAGLPSVCRLGTAPSKTTLPGHYFPRPDPDCLYVLASTCTHVPGRSYLAPIHMKRTSATTTRVHQDKPPAPAPQSHSCSTALPPVNRAPWVTKFRKLVNQSLPKYLALGEW